MTDDGSATMPEGNPERARFEISLVVRKLIAAPRDEVFEFFNDPTRWPGRVDRVLAVKGTQEEGVIVYGPPAWRPSGFDRHLPPQTRLVYRLLECDPPVRAVAASAYVTRTAAPHQDAVVSALNTSTFSEKRHRTMIERTIRVQWEWDENGHPVHGAGMLRRMVRDAALHQLDALLLGLRAGQPT